MDLFEKNLDQTGKNAPLAARMRPDTIAEVVGQQHLLGRGKFLSTMIERDQVPSMILWGPPGSGKTTMASVIAKSTSSNFVFYSAVLGSVKDVRAIIAQAKDERKYYDKKTILFVDEIHRFNKSQQDAFLPYVERGVITLIGATTENPSFEVNAALLSRCKAIVLKPLEASDLAILIDRALADVEKGFAGKYGIEENAKNALSEGAFGDARRALTALETAVEMLEKEGLDTINLDIIQESMQKKALLYDKAGDEHYNIISAFIKSMRGSDPDAAIYWMTRMLESGEDPKFILRRMIVFASEDIGSANPQALLVAVAAQQAFQFIGLPEGVLGMSQAVTYLASSPKSNASYMAYKQALADVKQTGSLPVPLKLRNAPTKFMKNLNYGKDYKYPHNYDENYVHDSYLPDKLAGRKYYKPTKNGAEKKIFDRLERLENIKKNK